MSEGLNQEADFCLEKPSVRLTEVHANRNL